MRILNIGILLIILSLIFSCNQQNVKDTEDIKQIDTIQPLPPKMMYELIIDSFIIDHGEVKQNQNLSELLIPFGISYQQIDELVQNSDSIFNLRKIRSGRPFAAFLSPDSIIQYFIYEHNPIDYVVFDFTDSVDIYMKQKTIETKVETAKGTIESSLWNAMAGNNYDPMLSIELSEIYAWSIDFFGLQKGDKFKVIYEKEFVDGESIGIGKISSAYFWHADTGFYAIPFVQDSIESFFDENGNSLRKAFLKAPLRFSRISSRFSNSRLHPVLKIRRPHHGVDYAAPYGTPVQAIGDGKIIKKSYSGGAGNMVKIKHNSVYTTAYLHLSKYGNIKVGDYVKQGDIIAYVGSTGLSTGPHLDFRFYKNGEAVDPLKVESPPVDPVKKENIEEYNKIMKEVIDKLDAILIN